MGSAWMRIESTGIPQHPLYKYGIERERNCARYIRKNIWMFKLRVAETVMKNLK